MGYVLMQQGEDAFIRTTLAGVACSPALTANWGLALATTLIGASPAFAFKERTMSVTASGTTIQEIGQTTPAGYSRQSIPRTAVGWPNPTGHPGASYTTTAPAKTFTFSAPGPTANGAQSWWVCKGTTVITSAPDDVCFGADLAAVRNFGVSDTETVTVSYQQT